MKLKPFLGAMAASFAAGGAVAGQATIYTQSDFRGTAMTVRGGGQRDVVDNGIRHVGSIVVHSGRWEFCALPDFRGRCEQLGPGRYASPARDWGAPGEASIPNSFDQK